MGVHHLETFIKQEVPGGIIDVSIKEECQQFER